MHRVGFALFLVVLLTGAGCSEAPDTADVTGDSVDRKTIRLAFVTNGGRA
jgi:hypothetical protein